MTSSTYEKIYFIPEINPTYKSINHTTFLNLYSKYNDFFDEFYNEYNSKPFVIGINKINNEKFINKRRVLLFCLMHFICNRVYIVICSKTFFVFFEVSDSTQKKLRKNPHVQPTYLLGSFRFTKTLRNYFSHAISAHCYAIQSICDFHRALLVSNDDQL